MTWLSKTRIQNGRQCHKRLWLEVHDRDKAQWAPASQARLDEGTAFGLLAQGLLGRGVMIESDHTQPEAAIVETAKALGESRRDAPMLFEAAFAHRGVRVRVDAFERGPTSDTLIEVKSTVGVKDEHLWDCAIQTWVARGSGRHVERILLAHLNREFVYRTHGVFEGLLATTDITRQVEALQPLVPPVVAELKNMVNGAMPALATGGQCTTPYACPFLEHCRASEPPPHEYPVDLLPRGSKVAARLIQLGHADLRLVPLELLESVQHRMIAEATRTGKAHVAPGLQQQLRDIGYPRYYLDFETISFAVPRWVGTRPFQQIPFQFSCHIEQRPGALRHEAHLDLRDNLPTLALAEKLLEVLGERGPIVVWNAGFEKRVIKELADAHGVHRGRLLALMDRIVDLLPIYRENYYHPAQKGSWSIKSVLPTVAPQLRYDGLEVGNGMDAQEAYRQALAAGDDLATVRRSRETLERYCALDTQAMVALASHGN